MSESNINDLFLTRLCAAKELEQDAGKGRSLRQLERDAGISNGTFGDILGGKRSPSVALAAKMLACFNLKFEIISLDPTKELKKTKRGKAT